MVQDRVNYNLSYFSSNYAMVFVMLSIYSLLTNLTLFFALIMIIGGMYGIGRLEGRDLDVGFARATVSQLYTGLFVISVVSFRKNNVVWTLLMFPLSLSFSGHLQSLQFSGSSAHPALPSLATQR